MQNFRNYYEILGVNRDAPADEIKRAYRQLARRYHPDVNPGNVEAENRFKEINEAYEVLFDPERRGQYDKFGKFWKQQGFQQKQPWGAWPGANKANQTAEAPTGSEPDIEFGQFRDFNTFVDELLRSRRSPADSSEWLDAPPPPRRAPAPPTQMPSESSYRDDRYDETPAPEPTATDWGQSNQPRRESWGGSEPVSNYQSNYRSNPPQADRPETDAPESRSVDRDRPRADAPPRRRPDPNTPTPRDIDAQLSIPLEKAYSGGRERIRLEDGRMLEVNLPAAMVSGQRVRLRSQGINGGDLYLTIEVPPHKYYRLNGLNLMTNVPITPVEAILGGAIEVPTLDGMVKINLPQNVKSGQKLRLGKKGYPNPEGNDRGDQIVELNIQTPPEISAAERELYEKLRQLETNPRSNLT
jgi:curved DNA-binding protein